jgi:hypothetical protein
MLFTKRKKLSDVFHGRSGRRRRAFARRVPSRFRAAGKSSHFCFSARQARTGWTAAHMPSGQRRTHPQPRIPARIPSQRQNRQQARGQPVHEQTQQQPGPQQELIGRAEINVWRSSVSATANIQCAPRRKLVSSSGRDSESFTAYAQAKVGFLEKEKTLVQPV